MLTNFAARAALLGVVAFALSCVDQAPFAATANELIVQAVLDAAAGDQYVIVQSTRGTLATQAPVTGAVVTLTLPDGRLLAATEERDSVIVTTRSIEPRVTTIYHFALARAGIAIAPGGTYGLRVVAPDGRVVTGSTTVPNAAPVVLIPPPQPFNRTTDTLLLNWQRVPGAHSYEVLVRTSRTLFSLFADTSAMLTGASTTGGVAAFAAGLTHQIVISAVDGNYYDYYRRSSDPFTAVGVINHLQGGIGVFGSIVEIRRQSVTVR